MPGPKQTNNFPVVINSKLDKGRFHSNNARGKKGRFGPIILVLPAARNVTRAKLRSDEQFHRLIEIQVLSAQREL